MLRKQASSLALLTDDFSVRWASLLDRTRTRLFRKRAPQDELVAEFEALIADRKSHDDLPYAGWGSAGGKQGKRRLTCFA